MSQVTLTEDANEIIREMIEAFGEKMPNMKFTDAEMIWIALMNYKQGVMRCNDASRAKSIGG